MAHGVEGIFCWINQSLWDLLLLFCDIWIIINWNITGIYPYGAGNHSVFSESFALL